MKPSEKTASAKGVSPEDFTILLSYSPDILTDLRHGMTMDLLLCGHTHGGQVNLPWITRRILPITDPERYLSGLVRESWGYTYVNRGIGTLVFPLRVLAPPEITRITLVRA
jgi:predicted MPP superfamily phosphohydrolase